MNEHSMQSLGKCKCFFAAHHSRHDGEVLLDLQTIKTNGMDTEQYIYPTILGSDLCIAVSGIHAEAKISSLASMTNRIFSYFVSVSMFVVT